jgi:replicative DNA helicase
VRRVLPSDLLPPQDLDAEQFLLSAAMQGHIGAEALHSLTAADYRHYHHGVIHDAAMEVLKRGKVVSKHSVLTMLRQKGEGEDAALMGLVSQIADQRAIQSNAGYWADTILADSIRRSVQDFAEVAKTLAQNRDMPISDVTDRLQSMLYEATNRKAGRQYTFTSSEVVPEVLRQIEARYDGLNPPRGISTGITHLDYYRKLVPGNLLVVAGRTSMGKTALALTIALNVVLAGHRVLYFSTEMPKDEIYERLFAMQSHTPASDIQSGWVLPHKRPDVRAAAERLEKSGLIVNVKPSITPAYLTSVVRRLSIAGPVSLVVADHIHRMQADSGATDDSPRYGQIAEGLKTLAAEFDVPVIALSQMNRVSDSRADKEPVITDIRGSGKIEEEADTIVFVYRKGYYEKKTAEMVDALPEEADLIVHKNRNGKTGRAPVMYIPAQVRFENFADKQYTVSLPPTPGTADVEEDPFAMTPDDLARQTDQFFEGVK